MTIDGKVYRQVNLTNIYSVSAHNQSTNGSLVDRGANGGVGGADVRIVYQAGDEAIRRVDIRGVGDHELTNIPICTVGGVVNTQHGPAIAIMNQYAYMGTGKTIHSCGQLEHYLNDVNDKSVKVKGGLQRIKTNDGYVIPINIRSGLPYIKMRPYTDQEWEDLPHVVLTSDDTWDPAVLDHDLDQHDDWFDAVSTLETNPHHNLFDEYGDYRHSVEVNDHHLNFYDCLDSTSYLDLAIHECIVYELAGHDVKAKPPDYEALRPRLGWLPLDIVKRTLQSTTQHARIPMATLLKKHFKSPFLALNVFRRNEPVAMTHEWQDQDKRWSQDNHRN